MPALLLANSALAGHGWQTYRNKEFSISVPAGWAINPTFEDQGYAYAQGYPDDKLDGVAFTPDTDLDPGTNLRSDSSYIAVEILPAGRDCLARNFLVDQPPDYFTREPEETPDYARIVSEPGDLWGVEEQVHIVSRAPCAALHAYINYGQLDDDRRKTERPFDRARLEDLLARIRRTLLIWKTKA
ncbi:MAG TPA: hypothetical protein VGG48_09570 [Rhizomicrobium sp.]